MTIWMRNYAKTVLFITLRCLPLLVLVSSLQAQRINLDAALAQELYFQYRMKDSASNRIHRSINLSDSLTFYDQSFQYGKMLYGDGSLRQIRLLPLEQIVEYNSKHPFGWNNGSMLRSRGLQSLTRFGLWIKYDWLEIQLQPEIVYSEQKAFDGFPIEYPAHIWRNRYIYWQKIDYPERYLRKDKYEFLLGQTQLNLNVKGVLFGFSNRNFWMGPGIHQSLLMTNNARAFNRLFIETERPLNLGIFKVYGQLFGGLTSASNEQMAGELAVVYKKSPIKTDRDRYINGFQFAIQPTFLQGLTVGMNRAVHLYQDNVDEDYFPVFKNLFRENDEGEIEVVGLDQVLSVYVDYWLFDNTANISIEYGRNDAAQNQRDFLLSPSHSFAYNLSFTKYQQLSRNRTLKLQFERTRFESTNKDFFRDAGSWYEHSWIRHGYTNFGEILGSGIGLGSNLTFAEITLKKGNQVIGITTNYLAHDKNFRVEHIRNREDWTSISYGIRFSKILPFFTVDSQFNIVQSQNYQWLRADEFENIDNSPLNLFSRINLQYNF